MLELIVSNLPVAAGIAISPLPIVSLLIVVLSGRSRQNAFAFTLGWFLAMMVVGFYRGRVTLPAQPLVDVFDDFP